MIPALAEFILGRAEGATRGLGPGCGWSARSALQRHFIVGMTNSAPSLMPDGQRDVTVLVFV